MYKTFYRKEKKEAWVVMHILRKGRVGSTGLGAESSNLQQARQEAPVVTVTIH